MDVELLFNMVILPVLVILARFFAVYLKQRTEEIKKDLDNETQEKYLDMATDAISKSVIMVNQTYVDSLKEQGKFNKEAQLEAFEQAKNTALSLMGTEAQKFLREAMTDFDLWLQVQIEADVKLNK